MFFQLTRQFITNACIIIYSLVYNRRPFKPANDPWVRIMYTQGSKSGLKGLIKDTTASKAFFGRQKLFIIIISYVCHCCGCGCVCCSHQLMNECMLFLFKTCLSGSVCFCYCCCCFFCGTIAVVDLTLMTY